jgi:hypothetical protein
MDGMLSCGCMWLWLLLGMHVARHAMLETLKLSCLFLGCLLALSLLRSSAACSRGVDSLTHSSGHAGRELDCHPASQHVLRRGG